MTRSAFAKPGDVLWVNHTCRAGWFDRQRLTLHDAPITVERVVPDSFGQVRLEGHRCDGTPIHVVVTPSTMTARPDGDPVRIGRAGDV